MVHFFEWSWECKAKIVSTKHSVCSHVRVSCLLLYLSILEIWASAIMRRVVSKIIIIQCGARGYLTQRPCWEGYILHLLKSSKQTLHIEHIKSKLLLEPKHCFLPVEPLCLIRLDCGGGAALTEPALYHLRRHATRVAWITIPHCLVLSTRAPRIGPLAARTAMSLQSHLP